MALDVRLWIAVSGCRRRIRAGMHPSEAATCASRMMDVDPAQVLRLAITAERACSNARQQQEPTP